MNKSQTEGIEKYFFLKILKWTLIGLLIRIIIMPFSLDADIFRNNYVPHQLAAYGNWDGYSFMRDNFRDLVVPTHNPFFPPLAIYIPAFFQSLFHKFIPTLKDWFLHYESWLKLGGGYALGHVSFGADAQLFRNLFFLKIPLLFFDFGIGLILLRLANDINKAFFVYKLWMLNLIVLHSGYASGQIDIYPTFFVMLALILSIYNRPSWVMVSLGLGTLFKSYPLILIPIAILYHGKTFKQRLKLLIYAIIPIALFYLPTVISSKGYSLLSLYPGGTIGTGSGNKALVAMKFLLILSYIYLLIYIYLQGKSKSNKFNLENYFFLAFLLLFTFQPIAIRYYIWMTPLLFLQFARDKNLWKVSLAQILALAELRLCSQHLWLGLFAPLHPNFFLSLPIFESFISPFINIYYLHRIMYRLFVILTLYMIFRTIRVLNRGYVEIQS